MRKVVLTFIVLLSLLAQSIVSAGQQIATHADEGLAHAVLHWEKSAHHHHDDGTYDQDESDESFTHLHEDAFLSMVGLASVTADSPPARVRTSALASEFQKIPAPFLAKLRRPPRAPA